MKKKDTNHSYEEEYEDYADEQQEDENTLTNEQTDSETTFKQRNDPAPVLEQIRLDLMNAYKTKITTEDKNGIPTTKQVIKFKKGTTPMMNKQGVNEFMNYLRFIINNHTVMGNFTNTADYNLRMRFISDDVACHLTTARKEWGISLLHLDIIMAITTHFIDIFLTRPLGNEERKLYGGFTESRTFGQRPIERRPGLMENVGRKLFGR